MTAREVGPDLAGFMSLIAQQSTTSQHAQQYDGQRTKLFVEYLASWITKSERLPGARATVDKLGDNALVMTVTMDNATPGAIALPSGPTST